MFYVAAFGRAEDEYRFSESGKVISKTDFPFLEIQPSFEKYQFCFWSGRLIPCAAIFSPIPTDRGMCCAFNMKSFDEIFVGEKFVNLAKELQEDDKNSAFMDATLPDWYLQSGMSAQPGD